jgi:2'-5' RNA ligase
MLEPLTGESTDSTRLFIAIDLSDRIRQQVALLSENLQKGMRFTPAHPSWVRPESIHLTLAFLGRKPSHHTQPIGDALAEVSTGFQPLRIELKGLGVVPHWRRPRVLWVGSRDRTHQIEALHEAIEAKLAPFDYRPDPKPFHPHLTLARFKSLRGIAAAESIVKGHTGFKADPFAAPQIALFSSQLHPSGARHTLLRRLWLGGTPNPESEDSKT